MSLGELIHVQHNLLRSLHAALPPAADRILLACLGAGVIKVLAVLVRHIDVGLFNAAQQLAIKFLLQRLGRLHDCLSVDVLGIEVRLHFWVLLVAEPEVIVDELMSVDLGHFGIFFGDWRRSNERRRVERERGMSHTQDYKNRGEAEDELQHFFILPDVSCSAAAV